MEAIITYLMGMGIEFISHFVTDLQVFMIHE